MFQFRHWPEGFEFPSCLACNTSTNNHDLLVSLIARMDPFQDKGNQDGKLTGLMKMTNSQFPGLFKKMMFSPTEARRNNRELGLEPEAGQTHQEVGAIKITEEFHQAVCTLAKKLSKGIYYRESKKPFPSNGCIMMNWFTNVEIIRAGKYPVFDLLKELNGDAPMLQRAGIYLNDQFEYKLSITSESDYYLLQCKFGNSFGLVVIGCVIEGKLEKIVNEFREKTERQGPFALLQSPILLK